MKMLVIEVHTPLNYNIPVIVNVVIVVTVASGINVVQKNKIETTVNISIFIYHSQLLKRYISYFVIF